MIFKCIKERVELLMMVAYIVHSVIKQEGIVGTYIDTYIYTHTHMHTCIHTYIHTYIHTHTHTYIHTYIHTSGSSLR